MPSTRESSGQTCTGVWVWWTPHKHIFSEWCLLVLAEIIPAQKIKSFTPLPHFKENQRFPQEWLFQDFQLAMKNWINYLGTQACAISHAVRGNLLLCWLLLTSDSFPLCNLYLFVFSVLLLFFVPLDILTGIQESWNFFLFFLRIPGRSAGTTCS